MSVRRVLEYPDERLRRLAHPVTAFDETLKELVHDLFETLYATGHGIGLCAPQVDDPRQVLVMDLSGSASAPQVFINPEVLSRSAFRPVEESCMSVPGALVNVLRATRLRIRAQDEDGVSFESDLVNMHAVCLQHEMDHFAGKLLVDRMFYFKRRRFERTLLHPA